MKRILLALLVGVLLVPTAAAAEPVRPDPDAGKTPAQIKEEAALKEKLIADKYREFEVSLLQLAQRLEKSANKEDRDRAVALRQALDGATKAGINTRMQNLVSLLKESKGNNLAEIKEAIDHGERLAKDLQDMIELLVKDSALSRNQALQKRLAELIKALEAIIRAQKVVRVHTEKQTIEQPMIVKAQDKVTGATDNFAKDMEDKNQPGHDRLPGKELVKQAIGDQRTASGNIAASKNDAAADNQTAAIDKLIKVRDALDKLLKQIRDDERKVLLASLQARCELMLQMQIEVYEGTVAVDKAITGNDDKKPARADHQKAQDLSGREEAIGAEADKAIAMIKAEGTAVAFLEVFTQMRQDMASVQRRLGKTDVGNLTQSIEKDIIDTLKEMIATLKQAQQPPGPSYPNPNDTPPPNDSGRLLRKVEELKMIRSMQLKINQRTVQYGKLYEGEEPADTDLRKEVRSLADRQLQIQRVTADIYAQKNQ
jgi:hypothetical protein